MLQNPRLGAPAFEYLHYSLAYEWPEGWVLIATGRRDGAPTYESETYRALSTLEVGELVALLLDRALGL